MDKVSVIMGAYNEEISWVEQAIESILNQSYRNIEFIIVLDNPDNEKLKNVISDYEKKDNRIRFFINEKNLGLVKTLNFALEKSTGKYIARMDADEISDKYRLEKQMKCLEENSELALVGGAYIYIDKDGKKMNKVDIVVGYNNILKVAKYTNFMAHGTFLYRKDLVLGLGGYRDIDYAEDYDLLLRCLSNNYKIDNIKEVILYSRIRENGISLSNVNNQFISTQYVQRMYRRRLKGVNDEFDKSTLLALMEKDSKSFWGRKGNSLYCKCLTNKLEGKKIKSYLYAITCGIISKKHFIFFKNLVISKLIKKFILKDNVYGEC